MQVITIIRLLAAAEAPYQVLYRGWRVSPDIFRQGSMNTAVSVIITLQYRACQTEFGCSSS